MKNNIIQILLLMFISPTVYAMQLGDDVRMCMNDMVEHVAAYKEQYDCVKNVMQIIREATINELIALNPIMGPGNDFLLKNKDFLSKNKDVIELNLCSIAQKGGIELKKIKPKTEFECALKNKIRSALRSLDSAIKTFSADSKPEHVAAVLKSYRDFFNLLQAQGNPFVLNGNALVREINQSVAHKEDRRRRDSIVVDDHDQLTDEQFNDCSTISKQQKSICENALQSKADVEQTVFDLVQKTKIADQKRIDALRARYKSIAFDASRIAQKKVAQRLEEQRRKEAQEQAVRQSQATRQAQEKLAKKELKNAERARQAQKEKEAEQAKRQAALQLLDQSRHASPCHSASAAAAAPQEKKEREAKEYKHASPMVGDKVSGTALAENDDVQKLQEFLSQAKPLLADKELIDDKISLHRIKSGKHVVKLSFFDNVRHELTNNWITKLENNNAMFETELKRSKKNKEKKDKTQYEKHQKIVEEMRVLLAKDSYTFLDSLYSLVHASLNGCSQDEVKKEIVAGLKNDELTPHNQGFRNAQHDVKVCDASSPCAVQLVFLQDIIERVANVCEEVSLPEEALERCLELGKQLIPFLTEQKKTDLINCVTRATVTSHSFKSRKEFITGDDQSQVEELRRNTNILNTGLELTDIVGKSAIYALQKNVLKESFTRLLHYSRACSDVSAFDNGSFKEAIKLMAEHIAPCLTEKAKDQLDVCIRNAQHHAENPDSNVATFAQAFIKQSIAIITSMIKSLDTNQMPEAAMTKIEQLLIAPQNNAAISCSAAASNVASAQVACVEKKDIKHELEDIFTKANAVRNEKNGVQKIVHKHASLQQTSSASASAAATESDDKRILQSLLAEGTLLIKAPRQIESINLFKDFIAKALDMNFVENSWKDSLRHRLSEAGALEQKLVQCVQRNSPLLEKKDEAQRTAAAFKQQKLICDAIIAKHIGIVGGINMFCQKALSS